VCEKVLLVVRGPSFSFSLFSGFFVPYYFFKSFNYRDCFSCSFWSVWLVCLQFGGNGDPHGDTYPIAVAWLQVCY
jgi:hypothetical protein